MTIVLRDRNDFSLDNYRQVAWEGKALGFSKTALDAIQTSRNAFMEMIDSDPNLVIYGVTSGYGQNAKLRFTKEQRRAHAKRRPVGPTSAFGEKAPERLVRGTIYARLANFVEGHAAVRPELAQAVAALLGGEQPLPTFAIQGQGGAGEILILAPLFLPMAETMDLEEKECLALINGSPGASAVLADVALSCQKRLEVATEIFALSAEAFLAPLEAYDPALEDLWGSDNEQNALQQISTLLSGGAEERRAYQAPVSFRILPRILGAALASLEECKSAAERALKAVTDNPVFLRPDQDPSGDLYPNGRALSTGGYHNADVGPVLGRLAASYADLAQLAERQATKMLDGNCSGLPDQLKFRADDDLYLGASPMAAVDFVEEAKLLAAPNLLPGSESGGFGQNDVASVALPAWRKIERSGQCLDASLAILAFIASQALFVTNRTAPPALRARLDMIRTHAQPLERMQATGPLFEALTAAFGKEIYPSGS